MLGIAMAYMNKYQSDDYRRDELIRIIEHSVEKLTLAELEALYYDMTTKSYITANRDNPEAETQRLPLGDKRNRTTVATFA